MNAVTKDAKQGRGNALFLILIAVALFAALSYAVTQSGRGGSGGASKEKLELDVARVMQDYAAMQRAVDRMLLLGCTPVQMSFQGAPASAGGNYVNASAPADNSCHVFNVNGGGLSYVKPPASVLDPALSGRTGYGDYFYVYNHYMQTPISGGVQNSVHLFLPYVSDAACLLVNQRALNHSAIPQDTNEWTGVSLPFNGTFAAGGYSGCENNPYTPVHPAACGGVIGCFESSIVMPDFTPANIIYQFLFKQ